MRIFIRGICLLLLFGSCNHSPSSTHENKNLIIDIQPFSNVGEEEIKYVYDSLKKRYPYIELKKSISFPRSAYYPPRNRYRADSLIYFLARQTPAGHVTIGLTDNDISTTKDAIRDWGVMGLGFRPGTACIASTFRLSKTERHVQLFKVAIHELGHTQRLPHCSVKSCFMRDAEGGNPTNEETDFCTNCKAKLKERGMNF